MVKPVADAVSDAVKGSVLIMDTNDYNLYDFMSWVGTGYGRRINASGDEEVDFDNCLLGPEDKTIQCVRFSFRAPEIVVHTEYSDQPDLELKWGRKNLALRDNNECQYCGRKVYGTDATIDHVLPQSRLGKNTWSNTVIACFPCNTRKADKTPEEAGMVLRKKPAKPKWYPITARYSGRMPSSWARWVPDWANQPGQMA